MFVNRAFLSLLLLLFPLLLFLWRRYRTGMNDFRLLAGPWRFESLKDAYIFKWFFTSLLLVIYLIFIILSLADIRFPRNPQTEDIDGRDIVFCVDISRSMLATDTGTSRLDLVRETLSGILEEGRGMRFGIVVFKGTASVLVPVTEDFFTLYDSLPYLGPGLISSPGTNIRAGLNLALGAFPPIQESRRQLVFFTDGENLEGSLDGIDSLIRASDAELTVVGTGTVAGGRIPLGNDRFVLDEKGEPVVTSLNEEPLRILADTSGGKYRILDQKSAVHGLVMELTLQKSVVYIRERLGYRLFLVPAFLAMFFLYLVWGKSWKGLE